MDGTYTEKRKSIKEWTAGLEKGKNYDAAQTAQKRFWQLSLRDYCNYLERCAVGSGNGICEEIVKCYESVGENTCLSEVLDKLEKTIDNTMMISGDDFEVRLYKWAGQMVLRLLAAPYFSRPGALPDERERPVDEITPFS